MRPIFNIRFVFLPEVTCNRKMVWVRRSSMYERSYFSVQNLLEAGLVVPEGWKGMCLTISTVMKDSYAIPVVFSPSASHEVKNGVMYDKRLPNFCALSWGFGFGYCLIWLKIFDPKNGYPDASTWWAHNLGNFCWTQLLTASSGFCIIFATLVKILERLHVGDAFIPFLVHSCMLGSKFSLWNPTSMAKSTPKCLTVLFLHLH